jgi:predicted secreted Zn-dependent protease
VTISVGNRAPVPQITSPLTGDLYSPGQFLTVTGNASDPEQGILAGSALSWRVILHHNTHIHILETHVGSTFQLAPPDHGDPDVYTEIELTATDASGVSTKTSINIYLNNNISADGNMVQNGSLETIDLLDPTKPHLWNKSKWGTNTAVFTYPVAGYAGANLRAAQIDVSGYVSGDAKWSFDPTYVIPNTSYTFRSVYKATATTRIVAAIVLQDGTVVYQDIVENLPASASWVQNQYAFVTPPFARSVSIYHVIEANGTLTIDDYSLMLSSAVPPPSTNLIVNPSLEVAVGALPQAWASNKWGTNTAVFTYPVAGQSGAKAAQVTVSGYTSGDAKWFFQDVPVTSGATYTFSDYYQSTVATNLVARFTSSAGTVTYFDLGAVPASTPWANATRTFVVPAGTASITIFHVLAANGQLTVDNFSLTTGSIVPTNLINNGFMETASSTSPTSPLGWSPVAVGGITTTFTYPVTGVDGGKGASIAITGYPAGADGNARWQFDEVPISTGIEYTYEGYYKGSTISDIIGRYTFNDGSEHYFGLKKEIPAAADWTLVTGKLVGPVNVRSLTLMHEISTLATLSIDNATLSATGTGTPNEIIPPTQAFTNPLDGAVVSGVITLTATATDNVGIAGLFFAVDGTPLGPEMLAPFTMTWDSRTVADGQHTLKVTTRDAVGNNNRQIITITVNNTNPPTSTSTNLIANPSLETGSAAPQAWASNKWGTNTAVFTYPVAGQSGAKAAQVTVSGYTSGDAKWFFQDVPVTPGKTYQYSNYYLSTAATRHVARYTLNSGAVIYTELGALPTAATWTKVTRSIVPPTNSVSMTVFHLLAANGQLTVDNYSLVNTSSSTPDTTAPSVTLTAPASAATVSGASVSITASATDTGGIAGVRFMVDGTYVGGEDTVAPYAVTWDSTSVSNGSHTLRAIARDVSGNIATSSPVSVTVSNTITNLILNPSMETPGTGGAPLNWASNKWGTNTAVFTYPVAGQSGANAAQVTLSAYTSGDAKWYFDDVAVTPGQTYTFTEYYKASVPTSLVIRYTSTTGVLSYIDLATVTASPTTWQLYTGNFTPPAGTKSVTIFHILKSVGTLATDNVSLK